MFARLAVIAAAIVLASAASGSAAKRNDDYTPSHETYHNDEYKVRPRCSYPSSLAF